MATIKKSLTARVVAGFGAVALATLTAFGAALPASAAGPNLDPADTGSLTVHKYDQPALAGQAGTGEAGQTVPSGANPLDGVEFTIYRVLGIDLSGNAGWGQFTDLEAADVAAEDLLEVASGTTGVDNPAGTAVFSDLDLGVYLVRETGLGDNHIAIPAPDFLVTMPVPAGDSTWNYDVHVYPKNPVGNIAKTVDEAGAHVLGNSVSWHISSFVPFTHNDYAIETYVIADSYDERLTVDLGSVVVTLDGTPFDDGSFRVEHDAANRLVSVTFEGPGIAALNDADGASVQVSLSTIVTGAGTPVSVGDGVIDNDATVTVNGNLVDSAEDITYWGALRIVKHAEGDPTALLSGAAFQIRTDATDANTTIASGSTDENGVLEFDGIITDFDGMTYWLVETEAPLGYTPMAAAREITIESGQPVVDGQNYEVVENAQVGGYMLPVTGGAGQTAFMIGGFGLLAGALGFMLLRRRKAQTEA